jgi:hypothetical protein
MIVTLTQTCSVCPSQWEGKTDDGRGVYVRYRWGGLSFTVAATVDDAVMGRGAGPESFHMSHGDGLDGFMTTEELASILAKRGIEVQ